MVWISTCSWRCYRHLIKKSIKKSINLQYHLWIVTIRSFTGSSEIWTFSSGALPVVRTCFGCLAHPNAASIKLHRASSISRRKRLWKNNIPYSTSSAKLRSLLSPSFSRSFINSSALHRWVRGNPSLQFFFILFEGFSERKELIGNYRPLMRRTLKIQK